MHDTLAMTRLILVEDDAGLRDQLKWALREHFEILEADSLASAKELAAEGGAPIVCLDLGLEGRDDRGLEVIDAILSADRAAKVIVIAGEEDGALAREAIRRGAFDFLAKPVDIGKLEAALDRAIRLRSLESAPDEQPSWTPVAADQPMLGESEPMRNLFATLHRLAQTDVNVLLTGESGTGKELCARAIHEGGQRARHPFVPIQCGAIPETLLESELFGYVKGAFSGADEDKAGLIETAHRGTLFFDEIGDMPPSLQVKLLRFLQDKRLQRIGEGKSRVLDVRVIAATNRPILTGSDGALRSDLYYRLSEFEVRVPPLRERGRDVLILAEAILAKNRTRFGRPRLRLSSRAEKALLAHGWPGNVRELANRLNRASIVAEGNVIEDADLELDGSGDATQSYREARKQFEKNLLLGALRRANGNVSLAARTVGVTRPTFYDMMRKTGIWVRTEAKVNGGEDKE
jgi:two-component system NtrC family response regulator